jgi:hypothetical protein
MFIADVIGALFLGYLLFKLERIDKRQDEIELAIARILALIPKRSDDKSGLIDT